MALEYIHSLKLIHCDLKPENILIKNAEKSEVKVIDFGSSCFIHDHLSSYVQSRAYRAPEVILGCKYDYKVDIWSLGCILAELFSGYVLFQNDSIQGLLARVVGICGPIPEYMMQEGKLCDKFFTREGLIYQQGTAGDDKSAGPKEDEIHIMVAKKTTLQQRLHCNDAKFIDFVRLMLEVDPMKRPTAQEALNHPFMLDKSYKIEE